MQRISATTGLMLDASRVPQETVGVLSDPERGASMFVSGHTSRRVAWQKTREANSGLELVSVYPGFLSKTHAAMMSDGQG